MSRFIAKFVCRFAATSILLLAYVMTTEGPDETWYLRSGKLTLRGERTATNQRRGEECCAHRACFVGATTRERSSDMYAGYLAAVYTASYKH